MLEELLRAADESGLELDLDRKAREFNISFRPGALPEKARIILYPLLSALEENFLITIAG